MEGGMVKATRIMSIVFFILSVILVMKFIN